MTDRGFNTQQVKDVVSFAKGKPPAEQPYFGKDAELYLTPEYLRGGAASEPVKANKNAARVSGGETIVLWDGSNAGEVFRAREGVLSSTMVHLKPVDSFDCHYFFYAMKGWEGYLKGQTSGSGIPHVDKEVLGKLELVRFPTVEQSKIAEILSAVDQAIEQTEALIAKQQRIKTGLMQDLLTRGIDAHGQLRTEQTHAFKDSPLGRIPVEWEVYPLSSLVDELITYGIVQAGPHIEGGIPYIRTGDMSGDEIVKSSLLCTSVAIASAFERSRVNEGDIVFSLRANVGKVLPIDEELAGSNLTQGTAKISPNAEVVSAFLIHALRGQMVQDQLRLVEKGTTFMEITLTDLRSIKVAFAVDELEQENIAKCFDACHSVSYQKTKELGKLKAVKASLMQDLLTGRKRVTDLLEPAAA